MHIDFKHLILHNFMSFGHAELKFEDDGFIRVTGINQNPDDNAFSNGAGKSSLWEALVWVITGETIRGTDHISNLYGEDGTFVEIEFTLDKSVYHLIRSKNHKTYKTSLIIEIDGKDCTGKGIAESKKLLKQYLPDLNASLLGSVIVLGQGLPQKFTNNTPAGRKEVLEKLSKSDFMIEDLKNRVSSRKIELNALIRNYQDIILSNESKRGLLANQIQQAYLKLQGLDREGLETQKSDLQSIYDESLQKLEIAEQQYTKIQEDINELNRLKGLHVTEETRLTSEIQLKYQPQLDTLNQSLYEINAELSSLNKEITRLDNIKDVCPTCGQKLIGVEKPDTSTLKSHYKELNNKKIDLTNQVSLLQESRQKEICALQESFKSINQEYNQKLNDANISQREVLKHKTEFSQKITKLSNDLMTINSQLAALDSTIQTLQETISSNQLEINDIDEILRLNTSHKELQQQHLEVVNKFETALKREFRGFLLTSIIEYIYLRALEYSRIIFETDKINFYLEGNNIEITYLDKPYENLSGGEKQKIDLIIQFSIRDMLCNHLGFTSNILVLDEVFDGLDTIGCQKVLDVISSMTDVKNVFIVTHRKDLSIPTDKEITVIKDVNGISELR